jgi:hypothetical protein
MAAGIVDLKIEQGAKFKRTLRALKADGSAVDWSYVTAARGQIRTAANAPAQVAAFTFDLSRKALGEITMSLTATETSALAATGAAYDKPTRYVYDIEFVGATVEDVDRILNGAAFVSPEVTK